MKYFKNFFKKISPYVLHDACRADDSEMIDAILAEKINVNIRDESNQTALFYLCCYREKPDRSLILSNINKLIAAGAQINIFNTHGETPLFNSLGHCDNQIALLLIGKGANPLSKQSGFTDTSLSKALRFKFHDVVDACLETFKLEDIKVARNISALYGKPLEGKLNALEFKLQLENNLEQKSGSSRRKI